MIYVRSMPFPLHFARGLKWPLLGWLFAEVVAFLFVVHMIGLGGAILLGLATTLLGILTLRRVGLDAARNLQRTMAGAEAADGALLDGTLSALGGILLIVPGYLSNLAGLALAAPSARSWVAKRFGGQPELRERPRPKVRADVIDLTPEDWRIVDH